LKGTAGTIGARSVQSLAAQLEAACSDGLPDDLLITALGPLENALAVVLAGIAALPEAPPSPPAPLAPAQIDTALRQLRALVSVNDTRALALMAQLKPHLAGGTDAPDWQAVAAAIDDYRFEDAARLLNGRAQAEA
ncbi:MAG TPA: hypothetical protein VFY12_03440, partial [Arenimonas sp.]|nr:hypothetical protein [Arenimonas sp.]